MKTNLDELARVSVVIPTADRQDMLITSLRCVQSQSVPASEVLVVDNGRAPIERDKIPEGVTVIRTAPRIGPGRARNIGAREATGEYVAFLDDDDLWDRNYLEKVIQCISNTGAEVVLGKLAHRQSDNTIENHKIVAAGSLEQRKVFYSNPGIVGSNLTVKRKLFLDLSGFDETMPSSEDRDLMARMLISGVKIVPQPEAIAILCDHAGDRAHHNMITGNRKFIKKHWRKMRVREIYLAVRIIIIRMIFFR